MILPSPTIHLDTTLADQYRREGLNNLIYIPYYPSSYFDYGPNHPRNQKFHINDHLRSMPESWSESKRQAFAFNYTMSMMMRFRFFLGDMDVLVICSKEYPPQPLNGNATLSIPSRIDSSQLSKDITTVFVDDPNVNILDILVNRGQTIALPFPHDWCASLPHAVNPERHYLFHSKAYLSRLPVSVPRQEIFKLDAGLILNLQDKPTSFVVKTTHGHFNTGTWMVTTEDERVEVLNELRGLLEPHDNSVPGIQKVLVTEFINAIRNYCVHFFVGRNGRSTFFGVTEQMVDRYGDWRGTIKFKRQAELKAIFDGMTSVLARALAQDGYIGPAGADILVDRAGKQWLIDLNPRINGGTPLCLLQQHLSMDRQLHYATVILESTFGGSQAAFAAEFQTRLHRGQVIVVNLTSWKDTETLKDRHSCVIICAAGTEEEMESIVDEIKDYCKLTVAG